ncbi:hypothetical protein DUNSADRAFT_2731, partial [Dunaliella salina]
VVGRAGQDGAQSSASGKTSGAEAGAGSKARGNANASSSNSSSRAAVVEHSRRLASTMQAMTQGVHEITGVLSPARKRLELSDGPSSAGVIPSQHQPTTSPHSSPRQVVAGLGDSALLQFTHAQQAIGAPPQGHTQTSPGGNATNQSTDENRSGALAGGGSSSSTTSTSRGPSGVWVYDAGSGGVPWNDAAGGSVGGGAALPHTGPQQQGSSAGGTVSGGGGGSGAPYSGGVGSGGGGGGGGTMHGLPSVLEAEEEVEEEVKSAVQQARGSGSRGAGGGSGGAVGGSRAGAVSPPSMGGAAGARRLTAARGRGHSQPSSMRSQDAASAHAASKSTGTPHARAHRPHTKPTKSSVTSVSKHADAFRFSYSEVRPGSAGGGTSTSSGGGGKATHGQHSSVPIINRLQHSTIATQAKVRAGGLPGGTPNLTALPPPPQQPLLAPLESTYAPRGVGASVTGASTPGAWPSRMDLLRGGGLKGEGGSYGAGQPVGRGASSAQPQQHQQGQDHHHQHHHHHHHQQPGWQQQQQQQHEGQQAGHEQQQQQQQQQREAGPHEGGMEVTALDLVSDHKLRQEMAAMQRAGSSPRKISFERRHPAPHEESQPGAMNSRSSPGAGRNSVPVTFVKLPEPVRFVTNRT